MRQPLAEHWMHNRGDYVRRYVPELRGVQGKTRAQAGPAAGGFPAPVVDHAHERRVSLGWYDAIRA